MALKPPGRHWSSINTYMAGLDCPFPTQGKSKKYTEIARSLERNLEMFQIAKGNKQRIHSIKN